MNLTVKELQMNKLNPSKTKSGKVKQTNLPTKLPTFKQNKESNKPKLNTVVSPVSATPVLKTETSASLPDISAQQKETSASLPDKQTLPDKQSLPDIQNDTLLEQSNGNMADIANMADNAKNKILKVGGAYELSKVIFGESGTNRILKVFIMFIVVLVIWFVYILITKYKQIKENKAEIDKDWSKYRCKPYVMPFAGWLVGPPDTSGIENFVDCSYMVIKHIFMTMMEPLFIFLDNLLNVILDLIRSVENTRKIVNYMRDSMETYLIDIGNMLYGYSKKLSYLFNRLVKTFQLMFQTSHHLFLTLIYAIYTVSAVWNSPIGGVGRYFCFKHDTLIDIPEYPFHKHIIDIKIGDELAT